MEQELIKFISTRLPIFHKTYFILCTCPYSLETLFRLGHSVIGSNMQSFDVFLETVIRISLTIIPRSRVQLMKVLRPRKNHFFSDRCKATYGVSRYGHKASEPNFPCSCWTCLMRNIFFSLHIYGSILLLR